MTQVKPIFDLLSFSEIVRIVQKQDTLDIEDILHSRSYMKSHMESQTH